MNRLHIALIGSLALASAVSLSGKTTFEMLATWFDNAEGWAEKHRNLDRAHEIAQRIDEHHNEMGAIVKRIGKMDKSACNTQQKRGADAALKKARVTQHEVDQLHREAAAITNETVHDLRSLEKKAHKETKRLRSWIDHLEQEWENAQHSPQKTQHATPHKDRCHPCR